MQPQRWFRVSLARKISLLFGTAVLLTIGVTLAFPWFQMTALSDQAMLLQAKQAAAIAFQAVDLHRPDWDAAQRQLDEQWPMLVRDLDVPPQRPRLVKDGPQVGPGFQSDAMQRLRYNPEMRCFWRPQDDRHFFRLAMAVRGGDADDHPSRLSGIIDVRLPIPQAPGVWNFVVTVLAGASGAVLAILVFYVVTQRLVLRPVRTLRRVTERVATGDIDVRSLISSSDEFEELSEAFNNMLVHLTAAQEEQRRINRSLDIKLGEMAEANVALFESNRIKSEFLANVTHELRTPLVSIIGFAELLRDAWDNKELDRVRLGRYSENILTSGRSLLDIINDLLDLTKIEAGKMDLHLSRFAIAELCRDMIDFVGPLAAKREQRLDLSLADDLPPVISDSGKLKQILYNLLSNAIKFTPTGGAVGLAVDPVSDDWIRLTVSDTGPGIPFDQQEIVFEKFSQLDASKTREYEGTGLGLAITRDLVHMLGGRISLSSEDGRGAVFAVELPATASATAIRPPVRLT